MARKFISGINLYLAGIILFTLLHIFSEDTFGQHQVVNTNQTLGSELDFLSGRYKVSFVYESGLISEVKLTGYKRPQQADLDLTLTRLLTPLNLSFKQISGSQYIIKAGVIQKKKGAKTCNTEPGRGGNFRFSCQYATH